jgi:hypothetical protein
MSKLFVEYRLTDKTDDITAAAMFDCETALGDSELGSILEAIVAV